MSRKAVIFAAQHALMIQHPNAKQDDFAVQIDYHTHRVSRGRVNDVYGTSIEVHGLIGNNH